MVGVTSACRGVLVAVTLVFFTHALALFAQDWTQMQPAHVPPPRGGAVMAQFGNGSSVVLFGGRGNFDVLGDTWIWNGSDWSAYSPPTGSPPARFGATMAYDPVSGNAVLFGGLDINGNTLSDTWVFNRVCSTTRFGSRICIGPVWSQVTSAANPPARGAASMAYDPARRRVVLNGGRNLGTTYTDTWEFDPATNSWANPTVLGSTDSLNAAMAQCDNSGLVMEFGSDQFGFSRNAFVYSGNFIEGIGFLGSLASSAPATKPLTRGFDAMAFYPVSGKAVLYGGQTHASDGTFAVGSDTWSGGCSTTSVTWTQQAPAHNPGPRWLHAMTTGPSGLTVLFFGGFPGAPVVLNSLPLVATDFRFNFIGQSDTWVWGKRAACLPLEGEIPANSKIVCQFTPADGIDFGRWEALGFAPLLRREPDATFEAVQPGPATITAQWSEADGVHTQTLRYTILPREHGH